jgi:hypothetical protein
MPNLQFCSTHIPKQKNGEGGIRTRGTRKGHTGFRNRLDQPLRHLSEPNGLPIYEVRFEIGDWQL